jgi:Zn-finger in ubiquitin-hydrolases and other protein
MAGKRQRDVADDAAAAEDGLSTPEKRQRLRDSDAAGRGAEADAVPSTLPADHTDMTEQDAAHPQTDGMAAADTNGSRDELSDDEPVLPASGRRGGVKKGAECPYLDTVSRQVGRHSWPWALLCHCKQAGLSCNTEGAAAVQNLDFDFEKCCSVSLSPVNVYACLVCGKYFQGRGPQTHAYTHALEVGHQMYMKLDTGKVGHLEPLRGDMRPQYTARRDSLRDCCSESEEHWQSRCTV